MRALVSDGEPRTSDLDRSGPGHRCARPRGEVIGICASTGGPRALSDVLGRLPAGFEIPILVVQHMTPGFWSRWSPGSTTNLALPIGLAKDGQQLAPGVWFAPDGTHLKLEATRRLRLDAGTSAGNHRPSGDVLLSAALPASRARRPWRWC